MLFAQILGTSVAITGVLALGWLCIVDFTTSRVRKRTR